MAPPLGELAEIFDFGLRGLSRRSRDRGVEGAAPYEKFLSRLSLPL